MNNTSSVTGQARSADIARALKVSEQRLDGPLKVSGQARFTADVCLPGMLWAKFLLSPVAHARVVSVDVSAAKAFPDVHAVLTGADIGQRRFGRQYYDWPVLATDRVRFIGDRVAAVAATSPEVAEEAVNLIKFEYEELPSVFDPEAALGDNTPILHPDRSEYYYRSGQFPAVPHPNLQGHRLIQKGDLDIEGAFARADRVFEDIYTAPRQHQGFIEPHTAVVWIESDGTVRVVSTNKSPFLLRHQLSVVTGVVPERIMVDSMYIGGDFGGKGLSIDEFACYYLAQATSLPVKSVMSYTDELQASNPLHSAKFYLRTGVTKDGHIIAHQSRVFFNGGAYAAGKPIPGLTPPSGWGALEVYNVPNARMETFLCYTNTVPAGQRRATGAVFSALAGEGHVDHIARELQMDPLNFRLANAIRDGDTGLAGEGIRNPRVLAVLEAIRGKTKWGRKAKRPNHGRGIAIRRSHVGQGKTETAFHLRPVGKIETVYGTPDQGSGSHTVIQRIAAAVLSVKPERILVKYETTAKAPYDPDGAGSSRVTHIAGQSAISGATKLKEKLEHLASEVMGWPAGKVSLKQDRFVVGRGSSNWASFEEVTDRILLQGPVEVLGSYDSSSQQPEARDFNFCAYMIEVRIDPVTGQVHPIEAVMAVDVGTIINPIAHQGQLEGNFVFGLSSALMEELLVEDGKVTNLSLGEYKLPTTMDIPPLQTVLVPTDIGPGPFGAKSVGEIANSAVVPAIANAVYDAVGCRVMTLPITAERVFKALRKSDKA